MGNNPLEHLVRVFNPNNRDHLEEVLAAAKETPERMKEGNLDGRLWLITSKSVTRKNDFFWGSYCEKFPQRQALVKAVLGIHRERLLQEVREESRRKRASIGKPWGAFQRARPPITGKPSKSGKQVAGNQGDED